MVEGKVRKYLGEITLLGPAVREGRQEAVGELLKKAKASVVGFLRYEVGEGIEKKQENFAAEVMAQVEAPEPRAGRSKLHGTPRKRGSL